MTSLEYTRIKDNRIENGDDADLFNSGGFTIRTSEHHKKIYYG